MTGYDGSTYELGDRVEIHPQTELWLSGVRFGTVIGMRSTPKDRVHVRFDLMPDRVFGASEGTFKAA